MTTTTPANASNGTELYTVPLFLSGAEVTTGSTFDVVSPGSGELVHKASSASVEDAVKAAESCAAAFPAWAATSPGKRRDIFLKAAEVLERRQEEVATFMQEETGAPHGFAAGFNVPLSIDILKDIAGRICTIEGSMPVASDAGTSAMVFREPYGVILGIAPWYVSSSPIFSFTLPRHLPRHDTTLSRRWSPQHASNPYLHPDRISSQHYYPPTPR